MMSALVNVVLNVPRYFMIAGLTILALVFYSAKIRAQGAGMDFEMVLPDALTRFVPAGLLGVLLSRGPDAVLARGSTVEMILDRQLSFDAAEVDFSNAVPMRRPAAEGGGPLPSKKSTSTVPIPGERGLGRFPY